MQICNTYSPIVKEVISLGNKKPGQHNETKHDPTEGATSILQVKESVNEYRQNAVRFKQDAETEIDESLKRVKQMFWRLYASDPQAINLNNIVCNNVELFEKAKNGPSEYLEVITDIFYMLFNNGKYTNSFIESFILAGRKDKNIPEGLKNYIKMKGYHLIWYQKLKNFNEGNGLKVESESINTDVISDLKEYNTFLKEGADRQAQVLRSFKEDAERETNLDLKRIKVVFSRLYNIDPQASILNNIVSNDSELLAEAKKGPFEYLHALRDVLDRVFNEEKYSGDFPEDFILEVKNSSENIHEELASYLGSIVCHVTWYKNFRNQIHNNS